MTIIKSPPESALTKHAVGYCDHTDFVSQQQSLLFKRISQIDSWTLGTLDAQKRKDIAFRLWIRRPFDDPP